MTRIQSTTMACVLAAGLIAIVVSAQNRLRPTEPESNSAREPIASAAPLPLPEPTQAIEPPLMPVTTPLAALPSPIMLVKPSEPVWTAPTVVPLPPEAAPPAELTNAAPLIVPAMLPAPTELAPTAGLPYIESPSVTPVVSVAPQPPAAVGAPVAPFPWKLCLEMVNGQSQFELRNGDESLLRVQCDSLDFSTRNGGIVARGKVVVIGSSLEARCDKATIAWQSGQVALDGGVHLSLQTKGVMQTMRAESLTFRLAGNNTPVEFTTKDVHQIIAPAGR